MNPLILLVPILLPVIGGFLIIPASFKDAKKRAYYAEAVVVLTSVFVWLALLRVSRDPVTVYSFTSGFSITFRIDGMSMLFAGMISVMWPLVMLYAFEYMKESKRQNGFFAFYVMTYGITLGIAFSADMITLYLFYEMLSLVTIPLVTHYGNHESQYAGRKYAAYTIGGASLAFFAVVMTTLYGDAGTFIFGGSLHEGFNTRLMMFAFILGFFGFGTKSAVFPLFDWLPTASAAPTPVTALLHAVAVVNSGIFAVTRMTYYVFGTEMLRGTSIQYICMMTAAFSLLFAAVMAVREKHFKRRLAFSTMSNLSYMLFSVMLLTPEGMTGGLLHMLIHGVIKMMLFLCAGAFMHVTGNNYVYEIDGVGKRMPVTFSIYTLASLSLIGIPMFSGFISKWHMVMAAIGEGSAWGTAGAAALIISAFICAVYCLTVSARAFFPMAGKDRYAGNGGIREAGVLMLVPIVFFCVVDICIGVHPGPIVDFVSRIAGGIL